MTICNHVEIYWSAENDNYYCKQCGVGMGHGVYSYISQLKNKAAAEIEALQKKYDDAYAGWKSYAERYTEADAANSENCKTIAALTKERDSLHSTVAKLQKDKERLDWLSFANPSQMYWVIDQMNRRQAIDDAMSAEKK